MDQNDLIGNETSTRTRDTLDFKLCLRIARNYPNAHIFVIEKNMTVGFCGGQELSKSGLPPESFVGKSIAEIFGDEADFVMEQYQRVFNGEEVSFELFFNGQHQLCQVIPLTENTNEVTQILSVVQNITPRKKIELELRQSRERYLRLVDNMPAGILSLDTEGRFLYANAAFCKLLGYTQQEILGLHILDTYPEEDRAAARQRLLQLGAGNTMGFERNLCRRDGSPVLIEAVAWKTEDGHLHAFVKDISGRKQTEEMLRRTQKLESLGALAGGIAHDFNNLLGAIFGNVDLALDSTDDPAVHRYLERAITAFERARSLTAQLLTFAKGGAPITRRVSLPAFVEQIVTFALSGSSISCDFDMPDNLWSCELDTDQMAQVIDNLVINARQAMHKGGTIKITGKNVHLESNPDLHLPSGPYVQLSFTDEGIGIPEEVLHRIFDPFYSTKPGGHGLGLATCHSIVKRHGGQIQVTSKLHEGATFTIHLPAFRTDSIDAVPATGFWEEDDGAFLIMDDDPNILQVFNSIIKQMGFRVLTTTNAEQALECFSQNQSKIVGVVLDLTVKGGAGGREVISEIRKVAPDLPAFVVSGYADDPVMANPRQFGFTASMSKPFRKSDLLAVLNRHYENVPASS